MQVALQMIILLASGCLNDQWTSAGWRSSIATLTLPSSVAIMLLLFTKLQDSMDRALTPTNLAVFPLPSHPSTK
jgi:hypothetical protein